MLWKVDGTAVPSMVRSMIERKSPREALASPGSALGLASEDEEDELIKEVGAMAYLAGSDTTAAAIESFFLAMLIYPDVQLKAQAEIDRVVGRDRLPNMDDMASLPYVNAMVTESLRWLPVAPLGIFYVFVCTYVFTDNSRIRHTPYEYG
jgi:cytochrome P450